MTSDEIMRRLVAEFFKSARLDRIKSLKTQQHKGTTAMPQFQMPIGHSKVDQMQWSVLDEFTQGYIEAMFFTDCHSDNPELEHATFRDLAPETLARVIADCVKFRDDAKIVACIGDNDSQAGHDFWLTRNLHGAGFWDGDWPEPDASYLDARSDTFGSVDLYRGDDGLVYLS